MRYENKAEEQYVRYMNGESGARCARPTRASNNSEVDLARSSATFNKQMNDCLRAEWDEIDRELPDYVAETAKSMGVRNGTVLPDYVYQACRMCFRMGMRVQRKLDRPSEETTIFWRQQARG